MTPEELARDFHENYERLAPSFGYETRQDSRTAWDRVPDHNKKLMIATAAAVITKYGLERVVPAIELPS